MLYAGDVAMTLMGQWHYGNHQGESPETVDQLDFFTFPEIEGGEGDPSNLIGSPGQDYLSITASSDNKEAARRFLTDYVMSEPWINWMLDNGYVPPVKGVSDMIEDPILQRTAAAFERANHVQVYWDQFLPPEVAETHKNLVQALFAMDISPEEFASGHEEAMQAYLESAE
jgi:raffinose/stachyose/melibiose transport system substrate-binding protein